jgi:DNA-binding NarL/FixJ family response regulator
MSTTYKQNSLNEVGPNEIGDVRILMADDHSMIRRGLKIFMQVKLGIPEIAEVTSCSDLLLELVKKQYTHLILDIILKDGNSLEIMPTIRKLAPGLKVMIFSMQPVEVYAPAVKQYQIMHYMQKSAGEDDMLLSLKGFLTDSLPAEQPASPMINNIFTALSPRELEVLHYLLKGYGTKTIGETLNLKMSTISTLKNRIYEKTKAKSLKELFELAALYNINY